MDGSFPPDARSELSHLRVRVPRSELLHVRRADGSSRPGEGRCRQTGIKVSRTYPVVWLVCACLFLKEKFMHTRTLVFAGASLIALSAYAQTDWPMFAHDPASTRYSPLSQITTANVSKLTQAWIYVSKPNPDTKPSQASKSAPLMTNGVLYYDTPYKKLVA